MRVRSHPSALLGLLGVLVAPLPAAAQAAATAPLFHDAHFHLTNYIQEGTDLRAYLGIMGTQIGRSTLFGIPLQQHPALGHVYLDLAWDEVAPSGFPPIPHEGAEACNT